MTKKKHFANELFLNAPGLQRGTAPMQCGLLTNTTGFCRGLN